MSRREDFPARFRAGASLTGMFQKFAHYQVTELLGTSGLDFAVLDCEHAPFDPSQLDSCILAAAAWDLPLFVRIAGAAPEAILAALDMGATGILAPHVDSAAKAQAIAVAARYAGAGRGFSPSTRAGRYGLNPLDTHMSAADAKVLVVAQIEDRQALEEIDAIAATPGIDALFVGRADLAASIGCAWDDPRLDDATVQSAKSAHRAGKVCGAYAGDVDQGRRLLGFGLDFLIAGSDQGSLRREADRLVFALADASGVTP